VIILLAACAAALAGCVWNEQEADDAAEHHPEVLSGEASSDLSSWQRRN